MTKLIMFDFDGTLADSFDNFLGIVDLMTAKYKLPKIPKEDIPELRRESAGDLIKRLKIPLYKIPFMARDMKRMQGQHIQTLKTFPGLPLVLKSLKEKGYKLGIVTSNGRENVKAFLVNNDMDEFEFLYADIGMFGKNNIFKKIIADHRLLSEEVVYVGDEIRDIEASKKAGIKIASVTWGFNSEEGLIKHNPDYIIKSPKKLLDL